MYKKVYTIYDAQPISYNAKKASKKRYQSTIRDKFIKNYKKFYPNLPLTTDIEARIAYYNREQEGVPQTDIDNLSKPTIDAFNGTIYNDDKQVIQRTAVRYDLSTNEIVAIDCSEMPFEIEKDVNQCMNKHIPYLLICSFASIDRCDLMEA